MTYLALGDVTTLRYSIQGLEPRDEILLKSLIRLLSHRTEHQWVCATGQAHLEVMGNPPDPASGQPQDEAQQATRLIMAHAAPPETQHFLRLPLHVNELELKLNQLGRLIAKAPTLLCNATPATTRTLAQVSPPDATPPTTPATAAPAPTYRLQRWPHAFLLTSSERLKLASLLTVRPLSLTALQERSGQTRQACEGFLHDLQSAGFLQPSVALSAEPQALPQAAPQAMSALVQQRAAVPLGLLARIRQRLGLQLANRP